MQQPLCHLYFFTLMEHLLTEPRHVNNLIRITGKISKVYVVTNYVLNCSCSFSRSQSPFSHLFLQLYHSEKVPLGDKIVLHIEKQAVLQCLLKEVASECIKNTNPLCITKKVCVCIYVRIVG